MKKALVVLVVMALQFGVIQCVFAHEDVAGFPACKYCGMNREMFAHSRMLVEYDNGPATPVCSLHCAALDLVLNIDRTPKAIKVGDYGTKKLIDAEKAVWVIGGAKPGVMTRNAKWAFESGADADRFVRENGGKVATFDEALNTAYKDIGDDAKMIRERRKAAKMKMQMEHKH
jgi:copper chaperone NosL